MGFRESVLRHVVTFLLFDYFIHSMELRPKTPDSPSLNMIFTWGAVLRSIAFLLYVTVLSLLRLAQWEFRKVLITERAIGPLALVAIFWGVKESIRLKGQIITSKYTPLYGPALTSVLVWVLLFRLIQRNGVTYVMEWFICFGLLLGCLRSLIHSTSRG